MITKSIRIFSASERKLQVKNQTYAIRKSILDRYFHCRKEEKNMEITKIVITGGPCGGKSTAMSWIQKAFTQMGHTVLFVPETATELITAGVAPWTCKQI